VQFAGSNTAPSAAHNMGHVAITVTIITVKRHDIVCAELHCNICKEIGGKQTVVWPGTEIGINRY
jgi:hypothetical protein